MIFTILDNQSGFWLIHKISEISDFHKE